MKLTEIHAVEYSVSQRAYHIETLDAMLRNNLMAIEERKSIDYLAIGFFDNYEAASNFIQYHRNRKKVSNENK